MRRALLVLVFAACGPKVPQGAWVEREAAPGQRHATAEGPARVDTSAIDVGKLDAAAIDALDEATALTLLERIGDAAPAARLALRAARIAHHRGDDAEARALIARAATAADADGVRAELGALATSLASAQVDAATVAVLLPLTGRYGALGREIEAAVRLAPADGTRWLVIDTRGEPDGAADAVERAVAQGAIAILGPIGSREAIAAARAASLRQIPIALLAPDDGADPSAGVFRLVDSPADEGRAAARLAREDGAPTAAVLAPRDDIGAEAAEAFVAEATRLGIEITANGSYDPTGGKVEPDVKKFLGLAPSTDPRRAAPEVPFSLLYVPDRYDRAAIVAAFLPYYGVELRSTEFPDVARLQRKHGGRIPTVVQLVGSSGWNHLSLPIRGGAAVQGALIVEACLGELGGDVGAAFAQAFQARTGRTPSATAAQAHDAALLVAGARKLAAAAPEPRAAMRSAIARGRLDDGACGPAAMDVDGELAREPSVLEVQGDQLVVRP